MFGYDTYIFFLSGPELADKKVLAMNAFAKALIEVTTEVDEDEDPQDAIKEYGKELVSSLASAGIAEAGKIAKLAKRAWREKKTKPKLPSYRLFPKGYGSYRPSAVAPAAAPAAAPTAAQAAPLYAPRPPCPVCGRTGHTEATCWTSHPDMKPVPRP